MVKKSWFTFASKVYCHIWGHSMITKTDIWFVLTTHLTLLDKKSKKKETYSYRHFTDHSSTPSYVRSFWMNPLYNREWCGATIHGDIPYSLLWDLLDMVYLLWICLQAGLYFVSLLPWVWKTINMSFILIQKNCFLW